MSEEEKTKLRAALKIIACKNTQSHLDSDDLIDLGFDERVLLYLGLPDKMFVRKKAIDVIINAISLRN